MADARLTHPTRPTLPLRQRQTDSDEQEAVADITREVGSDRPPLAHTRTRERSQPIRGLVTGNRLVQSTNETDDKRQALANYADRLEGHANQFQGGGYTYEDDLLDTSLNCILESVEWRLSPGQVDSLEYEASIQVGDGTLVEGDIDRQYPQVRTLMDTMLEIDGQPLPGFRDYRVSRAMSLETNPVFGRDKAENNDIVIQEGELRQVTFEGTATGTAEERETLDGALSNLLATEQTVTLTTKSPGYELEGFVVGYENDQQSRLGPEMNHYRLQFVEGIKS